MKQHTSNNNKNILETVTNNITEAKRYLAKAKDILGEKVGKGGYKDRKYVKMAGHTAYFSEVFLRYYFSLMIKFIFFP